MRPPRDLVLKISQRLIFLVIFLLPFSLLADSNQPLKIGLVLSGGGAKGGAHVGVLKIIDQLNIPIHYVVGTSMGAVVGALYASGYSGKQIENILTSIEWESILRSKIDRDFLYYRRKRDDDLFLISNLIGFKEGKLHFPRGIVQGHALYQTFKKYTLGLEPLVSFDHLPIPFRAIATDLVSGNKVVLSNGDLAKAMLASMSVPGLFPPVEINGLILVDGGVVNNLPMETAKELGADLLIIVDVGSPMLSAEEITDFEAVLGQLTNIYIQKNVEESLAKRTENDILISPDMMGIETADYDKMQEAVLMGEQAALKQHFNLNKLSGEPHPPHNTPKTGFSLQKFQILNNTKLGASTLNSYFPQKSGVYTTEQIDCYISHLYGTQMFESIEYTRDQENLIIFPHEKKWGPTFIQTSLFLSSDFEGDSDFQFGLGVTRTLLNPFAGELRAFGSLGALTALFLEWYQPFTRNLSWYVKPKIYYGRLSRGLYLDNEELSRYLISALRGSFEVGYNFREWGNINMGYERANGSDRLKVGGPPFLERNFDEGEVYLSLIWDSLDDPFFPHEGSKGNIQYDWHRTALGDDQDVDLLSLHGIAAITYQKHTGLFVGNYQTTTRGITPINAQFSLGGLFRLSGLLEHQLIGQEAALASFIYYYRVQDVQILPNYPFPIYAGFSLETGNTWNTKASLLKHSFRGAGSLFLGFDTAIGPFYLGYGFTENGRRAAHFYMGKPF